jgi:hypothetical protein
MTIKSVLCVLSGSPEEIDALNATLTLAGLNQSTVRLLPVRARSQTFADIDDQETVDADILRDIVDDLLESSNDVLTQADQSDEQGLDDENGDEADENLENRLKLVQQMTSAMIGILKKKGECGARDLAARGFTLDQIAFCWDIAEALVSSGLCEDQADGKAVSEVAA